MAKPVFVPLAAGIQTDLAEQLVQPGATLLRENCTNEKTGKVRVRLGSDLLATSTQATIPAGGSLPIPWQLATLEGMLVRFNRAPIPIHTWANPASAFVAPANTGGLESLRRGPIKLDVTPVFSGTAQVSDPTVAVGTNVIVEVYNVNTGFAGTTRNAVVILDRLTRRPLFVGAGGGSVTGARVAIVGSIAVVAGVNSGGNLAIDSFNLTTCALAQSVALGATLGPFTPIDMRVLGPVAGANNVHILYRDNTGVLKCAVVDATNLAVNQTFGPRTTAAANVSPNLAFGWMQDFGASGKFSIMIADTTNGLRVLWDLPAPAAGLSNATATHVLDAGATGAPTGITSGIRNLIGSTVTNSATGVYRVLYEVINTTFTTQCQIKIALWNGAASTGIQYRSAVVRSKFWKHSTNLYFLAAYDDDRSSPIGEQRTYFVLAMSFDTTLTTTTFSAPLAVALPRDAGGITESISSPSDAAVDADGTIFIGVTEQVRTDLTAPAGTATGVSESKLGADLIRVRHPASAETELGRPTEFIRSLFVPGGSLGQFDGMSFDAACFPYFPSSLESFANSVAGGSLTHTANYFWRVVYAKIDRNGRVWRSSPSDVFTGATTGANFQFDVTVETLRLVDRGLASGHTGNWIELYRSQANAPDAFFQVAVVLNDPTVDTLVIRDNVPDASLGEELYTDGGGLENQLLPSISCSVEYQGRLVCAEEGTGTFWYSLEADFDHGLIFHEALTVDVGDPSDPITGLAVFGETLFVFKAGKIYVVPGQGANALGQGATYTPRLIEPGIGCINPQSIVVADDGVWFRANASAAGIHRTSGGAAEYVGDKVRDYEGLTITGAVVVRDATEIRFYTLEGTTLVWDWNVKTWGTNTSQPCLTATIGYSGAPGVVYARASDSAVLSEATEASHPSRMEGGALGTNYTGKIRTPWFQGGGPAGWHRVRRLQGVGDAGGPHVTTVRLYKNLSATPFQTASLPFAGTEERWTWEIRPAQQKASATMIEVEVSRASVAIVPDTDDDQYLGGGLWNFDNGAFTSADIGGTVVIAGAGVNYDGTYTITAVPNPGQVVMSPLPIGGPVQFDATSITLTRPMTAGPGIVGVSLLPISKEGMDKLPATRRPT